MIAHIEIEGCHYYNVTEEYLQALDVPENCIDTALKGARWKVVSEKRFHLLFETDWTQGADSPLNPSKIAEFAKYRQELRDIPQVYSNPDDVVWPEKPTI